MPTPPATSGPRRVQRLLLGLLLALLVLPALQAWQPLVVVPPLGGYTPPVAPPTFSWRGLLANSLQPQVEHYLNEQLGFRPWLVRLRNQVAYSAWHQLLTPAIYLGRDQTIYQQGPVDAYLGRDFLGEAELARRVQRLRRIQDSLQAHGTRLLFVIAPGKARLYPQLLADTSATHPIGPSNYEVAVRQLARYGVSTLDAAALLLRWRDEAGGYPLFPRTGTHWSGYAVARVADTLFARLEALTGHDLPDFAQQGPPQVATRVADLRFTDNDLGELANLLRPIPPYPMAYPRVVFAPPGRKQPLNALFIGDSFAQSFYGFYPYYPRLLTPTSRYWNYGEFVYWPEQTPGESRNVAELNLAQQLRGREAIVLVCNEEDINKLTRLFSQQLFDYFCPLTPTDEARIASYVRGMRQNPEWLRSIEQKADDQHIPLEQALRNDALYMNEWQR